MRFVFGAGVGAGVFVVVVPTLLALHHHQPLSYRARIDRQSMNMANRSQTRNQLRIDIELEQAGHLPVAILFDDIYPLVLFNKFVYLARKGIGTQAQIVSLEPVLFRQLIARFDDRPVRTAECNNANLRFAAACQLWPRNIRPRGLKLLIDALHVAFKIIRTLAILRSLIVPTAARKPGAPRRTPPGTRAQDTAVAVPS